MSDRESYQQAVETFLSTQNLSGHFQLAALPIQIWFTRHDFSAPLWRLAQQISPENPIILFRENALSVEAIAEDTEYLVQESVTFEPFLDIFSKNALPDILKKGFFAELIGLDERHFLTDKEEIPLQLQQTGKHYYAVIDTSKVVAYPSALKGSGQIANLYKGKTGETLEDAAPYLFEFDPGNSGSIMFLQKLFRKMESRVLSHWKTNPVIFIRSDKDFDMVYHHLRKFTHLYDPEEEIWYFFRFYDPKVLSAYLPPLSRYPANLAALFGSQNGDGIIDAFGLRLEDEFITFTLNPLPENTRPAKIEFGKVEHHAIRTLITTRFKRQLMTLYDTNHPQRFRTLKDIHKSVFFEHVYNAALSCQLTRPAEIAYFGHVMLYLGAYWYADPLYHFINRYLDDERQPADRRMEHITSVFNNAMPAILGEQLEHSVQMANALLNWYVRQPQGALSVNNVIQQVVQVSRPYFSRYVTEKHLIAHVHHSLAYAQKQFGITHEHHQGAWLLLSLVLGIGFDRDPLMPWAGEILNCDKTIHEKIELLLQMLAKRASKMCTAIMKENP
ncbi:DUF4123 domain-containing protein [Aggregatibacter actinomycetemcomitans]|uniref:DUF4123 domain-containing protein n=1 Tax=Aggregatibacter actinomycetemcomitans TaxID=714 RepID=UPI00197C15F3|nr:DUF4123 domain-containing protein [Aggregatibacter actinomycetemcomitans]MBN6069271.1 DUF4123 domain-containing protein [Aggregatibacter actinomycetemcomitans]MBN6085315.1 DUF4123 domain-containing protein [Aggregatibacter actinomycetemcomitans]